MILLEEMLSEVILSKPILSEVNLSEVNLSEVILSEANGELGSVRDFRYRGFSDGKNGLV